MASLGVSSTLAMADNINCFIGFLSNISTSDLFKWYMSEFFFVDSSQRHLMIVDLNSLYSSHYMTTDKWMQWECLSEVTLC